MPPSLLLLAVSLLAAAPGEAASARNLAGVDIDGPIQAFGADSDWELLIGNGITVRDLHADGSEETFSEVPTDMRPVLRGGTATYTMRLSDGGDLIVVLAAASCRIGSDDFPLTAVMRLDGREWRGCARALDAMIRSAPPGP